MTAMFEVVEQIRLIVLGLCAGGRVPTGQRPMDCRSLEVWIDPFWPSLRVKELDRRRPLTGNYLMGYGPWGP